MGLLENKVAVITGAAAGMGRATAQLFAREGARVVLADVQAEGGGSAVNEIKSAGGEAIFVRTDVSQGAQVRALIAQAVATFGQLDVLFNNAGIEGSVALFEDADEDDFERILSVNLRGVFLGMKYGLPELVRTRGVVVNTASLAGLIGVPGMAAYAASKGGVVQLTKTAALEYAAAGVRVNCICPGYIRTDMTARLREVRRDERLRRGAANPLGRAGTPEDIAGAALYLASDLSGFVTGIALPVDGGTLAE